MKEIKQYVVLVDSHRKCGIMCPAKDMLYQRATKGRYRVAAKNEKEAQELVQKAVGFGSVHVYYEDKDPKPQFILPYRQVAKEDLKGGLIKPMHATEPQTEQDEEKIPYPQATAKQKHEIKARQKRKRTGKNKRHS